MLGIKEYDVIMVQSKGFVQSIIRAATKSEFNHCAIVVKIKGVFMIAEAVYGGFRITKTLQSYIDESKEGDRKIKVIRNPNVPLSAGSRFTSLLNKKYEYVNLVFFQLRKAVTGKYKGTTNIDRVICSEACGFIHAVKGYYGLTPQDLNEQGWDFVTQIGFEDLKLGYS